MNSESLFFLKSSCWSRAVSRAAVILFNSATLSSQAACCQFGVKKRIRSEPKLWILYTDTQISVIIMGVGGNPFDAHYTDCGIKK